MNFQSGRVTAFDPTSKEGVISLHDGACQVYFNQTGGRTFKRGSLEVIFTAIPEVELPSVGDVLLFSVTVKEHGAEASVWGFESKYLAA